MGSQCVKHAVWLIMNPLLWIQHWLRKVTHYESISPVWHYRNWPPYSHNRHMTDEYILTYCFVFSPIHSLPANGFGWVRGERKKYRKICNEPWEMRIWNIHLNLYVLSDPVLWPEKVTCHSVLILPISHTLTHSSCSCN